MVRLLIAIVATASLSWAAPAPLQETACAFENGGGMRIQYTPEESKLENGKIWTPGGQPIALFLDTSVAVDGTALPVGAYGLSFCRTRRTGLWS